MEKNFLKGFMEKLENQFNAMGLDGDGDVEVDVVEIDGVEYSEVMRLSWNGNTYVYLSDLDHPEDFLIQRYYIENGEEYIVGLESTAEFDEVMKQFAKRMLND